MGIQQNQQDGGYIEQLKKLLVTVDKASHFTEDNSLEEIQGMLNELDVLRHEFLNYGARTNNPEALEDILSVDQVTYALLRLEHAKRK
jgi:hypothetical protein